MLKFLALSALLAIHVWAAPDTSGFCGTVTDPHAVAAAQAFSVANPVNATQALNARATFNVPVVFNVFYDQNNPRDGNVPDNVITQQMAVINTYFQPMRLTFTVTSVRRFAVPYSILHGAAPDNDVERQIKSYHQGNAQTLNLYIVGATPNSRLAGWSSFPWQYQSNPMYDGIIMRNDNLPGGTDVAFNMGKMMVHEIGHWVGLLHPFEGGCNGGDYVDDTPAEAYASDGCPVGRDTCAGPGVDPIDNIMDYSVDQCKTRFTSGQYNRLVQILYNYRGINLY